MLRGATIPQEKTNRVNFEMSATELQWSPAIIAGQWQSWSGVAPGAGTTSLNQWPAANTWDVKSTMCSVSPGWTLHMKGKLNQAHNLCTLYRLLNSLCWTVGLRPHWFQQYWPISDKIARFHQVFGESTNNNRLEITACQIIHVFEVYWDESQSGQYRLSLSL